MNAHDDLIEERLTSARHSVQFALDDVNQILAEPGNLPRIEQTRLKDQRTKLSATIGALGGTRERFLRAISEREESTR